MFKCLFGKKRKILDKKQSKLLFQLYFKTAYRASYFYCGNKYIAEEAAQEGYFKSYTEYRSVNRSNRSRQN